MQKVQELDAYALINLETKISGIKMNIKWNITYTA